MSEQSLEQTLKERGGRYGTLLASGTIAMDLEDYLRAQPNWQIMSADKRESLAMICHKISRIVAGDPEYADSWVDIAGYAKIVADGLLAKEKVVASLAELVPPGTLVPTPDNPLHF